MEAHMIELNFLAFCITVIALLAIVYSKDKVTEKALSLLGNLSRGVISTYDKVFHRKSPIRDRDSEEN
jgi:hypothetical protein